MAFDNYFKRVADFKEFMSQMKVLRKEEGQPAQKSGLLGYLSYFMYGTCSIFVLILLFICLETRSSNDDHHQEDKYLQN